MLASVTHWLRRRGLRLVGLALLVFLLIQIDLARLVQVLRATNPVLFAVAVGTILPMIGTKTVRWLRILHAQAIPYRLQPAFLAYLGSMFVGLLTPGRLGEFVKALHVSRDCGVPLARAFSSVLVDRLYDLYLLLIVGSAALLTLVHSGAELLTLVVSVGALTVPLALFLSDPAFAFAQHLGRRFGRVGQRVFATDGWLVEMRNGIRQLSPRSVVLATALTVVSYGIFFGQCYLLALALKMPLSYVEVSYAVAIGSLVTLLPISISGLGTREASIIAYLGTAGIPAETALGFSILVFTTFYLSGGLMGAVAWWVQPAPLDRVRAAKGFPE
ncbi:MAG: flippase-like domain-containing protein [Chloroflexaceae bacterium]|nr:flippase-like domain-containing protein [Chloroflexaceae bacterium]